MKDWRNYSQVELDSQYDQRTAVPNASEYIDRWSKVGEQVKKSYVCETHQYGSEHCELLDFYPGDTDTIHVHIHGGAWRALSKDVAACVVPGLRGHADGVAVLGFGLAPAYHLSVIVFQIQRAVRYVMETWPLHRIILSGHSSGAHLASNLLTETKHGLTADELKRITGVLLASGPYDLRPVRASSRNVYMSLTREQAEHFTPLKKMSPYCPPILVCVGDQDLQEFKRQGRAMVSDLAAVNLSVVWTEFAMTNHFEVYDLFGAPHSLLTRSFSNFE